MTVWCRRKQFTFASKSRDGDETRSKDVWIKCFEDGIFEFVSHDTYYDAFDGDTSKTRINANGTWTATSDTLNLTGSEDHEVDDYKHVADGPPTVSTSRPFSRNFHRREMLNDGSWVCVDLAAVTAANAALAHATPMPRPFLAPLGERGPKVVAAAPQPATMSSADRETRDMLLVVGYTEEQLTSALAACRNLMQVAAERLLEMPPPAVGGATGGPSGGAGDAAVYALERLAVAAEDLPAGVDAERREAWLADGAFEAAFGMDRGQFGALLPWKQRQLSRVVFDL